MGAFATPVAVLQAAMTFSQLAKGNASNENAGAQANARIADIQRRQAQAEQQKRDQLDRNLASRNAMIGASGASGDGSAAAVSDNLVAETDTAIADADAAASDSIAGIQESLAAAQQRNLLQQERAAFGALGRVIKRRNLI